MYFTIHMNQTSCRGVKGPTYYGVYSGIPLGQNKVSLLRCPTISGVKLHVRTCARGKKSVFIREVSNA